MVKYFAEPSDNEVATLIRNKEIKNIAQVRNSIGEEATKAAVAVMVDDLQKSIQLTQPMTPFQIDVAAEIICREYYYLKLEELRLCFINAISGKYGKIYNRIDAAVICEWLSMYVNKRATVSERLNAIDQQSNNIYDVFNNDTMRDALKFALEKIDERIVEQPNAEEPDRKPTPFEQSVMDEWDAIPEDQRNGWLRNYSGMWMDFDEYRKTRYNEEVNNQTQE